jgi:C4-dicarboxylate-specific signal transduction histidine kinase
VYRWFLARAEPVRDDDGRIIRWCGTNIDIEDRKQAENALKRSEAYLAEAQRLSKTGSFSWNVADGRMCWSGEAYRIFELEASFEPSVPAMLARVHPDDLGAVRAAFVGPSVDESLDLRCRLLMPDRSLRYLRIVGRVMSYSGRSPVYAGAFMDVTDARIADEKLYQAQTALTHVSRVLTLGELAASITHEINQPLTGIVSNGEACARWLDRENPDIEEVRSNVVQMVLDCRRAVEVQRRLRALIRKADPEHAALNVNEVVLETIPLIQREITDHRSTLELQLAPDLPLVRGDKIQIQQVIINLVVNGVQAMDAGSDSAHVLTIRTEPGLEGGVMVAVIDSGRGIDDGFISRVFDAFFTTKSSGLGIGLSICRSIVESHHGEIWASNNPDRGATFSFVIPLARTEEENRG